MKLPTIGTVVNGLALVGVMLFCLLMLAGLVFFCIDHGAISDIQRGVKNQKVWVTWLVEREKGRMNAAGLMERSKEKLRTERKGRR